MLKLFSGSASINLTEKVSRLLDINVSASEIIRFTNSEVKVRINEEVKNHLCVVIQSTSNPTDTHLMELFFFCDALKRIEAKKVIAFIPYFGYARQNIQHITGECVSANVVIRFLEAIGFYKIYTIDLHDEATEGVFSIPFKNLSALPLLALNIKNDYRNFLSEIVIASPDQGGIERARKFSQYLFNKEVDLTIIEKKRNLDKAHQSQALALYGNIRGKVVVIVDDVLTSGRTLINAAKLCLDHGAKKVIAAIVHPDLSPEATGLLEKSSIESIYTTDTIVIKPSFMIEKFKIVSVAGLIANEIKTL